MKPVTLFADALKIARERPDDLKKFELVGDRTKQWIIDDLEYATELLGERASLDENAVKDAKTSIKKAWGQFSQDYLAAKDGEKIENPERYINQDESLTIEFYKTVGRRPGLNLEIPKGETAVIYLTPKTYDIM